ncbi:MAG TPA: outer membrane protein transport protein [Dehalococcoidia bacterium]|nr:outer membrane protein transport protein [Dehalococcoidia bacterium]
MKLKTLAGILAVAGLAMPGMASATNGYFSHGIGIKAKGMGGVGIALSQDSLAAATNPAGMVLVGDRMDLGVDWFRPDRTTTWQKDNPWGMAGAKAGDYNSGSKDFLVPEFGYNMMLGEKMSLGISVYGNGGMNTDYGQIVIAGGTTNTYSNLEQLFISPTVAYKLSPEHSIGVSLNLVYQTFEARGLQAFQSQSSYSGDVTDRGKDTSTGAGLKFGWTGQISPEVTLGATYQFKTKMSKFDKYKGLFAEQGGFDIPETYGVGIAVKASPKTTVAADIVQINYGGIRSLANQGTTFPLVSATPMGADNGSGFGWKDQTVYKLAISHQYRDDLVLRAGYNYAKMPITENNTFFNILAPATVEQHLTLGATWTLANKSELSVSYMHAFDKGINGPNNGLGGNPTASLIGYPVNLKMNQDSLGIAYGMKM